MQKQVLKLRAGLMALAVLVCRSFASRSCLTRSRPHGVVLVVLVFVPAVVLAQPMRWPEAVAALAGERARAEECARLLKRHAGNDAAALSRGELAGL
jgi:hypothetical protein